jgi:hypothetical protein
LVVGNNFYFGKEMTSDNWNFIVHRYIDLILYDILTELFDEEFTKWAIQFEVSLWTHKGISPYKLAWDEVTKLSKEQRQKEFRKYLQK